MGSDMVVALARATQDRHVLFGHNNARPTGEPLALVVEPGRELAPGQMVRGARVELPQLRHTYTVLGCRAGLRWGYQHGLNEKGVAMGTTPIWTRLERLAPGLTGADLVRLVLERAGSALQAVDLLADLISRHGQGGEDSEDGSDNAFVVADGQGAYVLEACDSHWASQTITGVRAVSGACHLRRDWDRISPGVADLAIQQGWWPADGSKLDFAGALGREGTNHAAALRRWGQTTVALEQHNGALTVPVLRSILASDAVGRPGASEETAPPCLIARLSARPGQVPVAWCSLGAGLHFPLLLVGDLPAAFADEGGAGEPLWRQFAQWQESSRRDTRLRSALRGGLARLQERFDQNARELLEEVVVLRQRGAEDELRALAGSFMQDSLERFEELTAGLPGGASGAARHPERPREESVAAVRAWVGE